jgi:DNA-binding transcriptional MerR regulator
MNTLTTGQVSGLLGIPVITLQRYIREYRVYFSPTAILTTRGRRFTSNDVSKILTIRTLNNQRVKKSDIIIAIENPDLEAVKMPDLFSILLTINAAIEYMEKKHREIQATIESFARQKNRLSYIEASLQFQKRQID